MGRSIALPGTLPALQESRGRLTVHVTAPPRPNSIPAGAVAGVWLALAAVGGVLALIAYQETSFLRASQPVTPASDLALRVERDQAKVRLSWDPWPRGESAVVRVLDGKYAYQFFLTGIQFRQGTMAYSPIHDDIVFQITAYDSARKSVTETTRYIAVAPTVPPPDVKPVHIRKASKSRSGHRISRAGAR